jgi:NADH-quinone oxidoreductase B subunit
MVLKKIMEHARKKSPWIMHFDCGGCNGCSIEVLACLTPRYDIERFGMVDKGNPRHSDILVVQGIITRKVKPRLQVIYEQMASPKAVVAVGACAVSSGVFSGSYNVAGPLDKVVPVDVYVPGCPPRPEAIISGITKAVKLWKSKKR